MLDPYRMVVVNFISVIILIIIIIIYKFIFPKKNLPNVLIIILVSLLPLISLLRIGSYESGDFNIHIYRSISFFTSLSEGQLIPNWSKNLNATYGYPTFIIGAPLTYYLNSLLHLLGFSFVSSMKIFLAITYIFSGLFMYKWIKTSIDESAGLISAIFYLYAPYHLVDLHFRISPGDMLLYALIPLSAYLLFNIFTNHRIYSILLCSISIMFIFLSHPLSLVANTFLILYCIFLYSQSRDNIKGFILCLCAILFGALFSAYYWMPILIEKIYILTSLYPSVISFEKINFYLYSNWMYGFLFQGPKGQLSFLIGYIQIIVLIYALYLIYKNKLTKRDRNYLIFFSLFFIFIFFLFTKQSQFVWNLLPFYKNMEFAYRLSLINVLLVSVICGITLKKINKIIITLIIFVAILQTILNWGHRRVIPTINDNELIKSLPYSTYIIEGGPAATPKWVNPKKPWMNEIPKNYIEILSGDGKIISLNRTTTQHFYLTNLKTDALVKENTYYYPGWKLYINGKESNINYTTTQAPNINVFNVPKGIHKIELKFEDTTVRRITKLLSLFSFIAFLIILIKVHKFD